MYASLGLNVLMNHSYQIQEYLFRITCQSIAQTNFIYKTSTHIYYRYQFDIKRTWSTMMPVAALTICLHMVIEVINSYEPGNWVINGSDNGLSPVRCQSIVIWTTADLLLTHWGRDKMVAIFQTTFSNAFSWMKLYKFRLRFHWNVLPWVQLTIFHHWFK